MISPEEMAGTQQGRLYRLIEAIQREARFDHAVEGFELIETHISYILLTGPYAYKFKKPMELGFLDFGTLEKRKFYCEEEIRLNSRLAPGIYQAVIAVTGDERHPRLGGAGAAIEYAVKMVQFPAADELERVIAEGRLEQRHIDLLADTLAGFHGQITRAGADSRYGSAQIIRHYAMENFTYILPAVQKQEHYRALAAGLEHWTGAELNRLHDLFLERRRQGFIRECHGDLHAGNIALYHDSPVIFDCIEFNPELYWIDTMSEIAFLIMDLDARGRAATGWRFLNRYLELTGDYAGVSLLRFYLVYRALVRCKIASIRLGQPDLSRQGGLLELQHEHRYLDLAAAYTGAAGSRLIITHGLSGSGKTTVSQALLEHIGAVRLRSDIERIRLFATPADAVVQSAPGQGKYAEDAVLRIYRHLAAQARAVLAAGFTVIVDAAFLRTQQRDMFRHIAADGGYPFFILDCQAPAAQLRERLEARQLRNDDASEAGTEVLDFQLTNREPLSEVERRYSITVDNAGAAPGTAFIRRLARTLAQQ